MVQLEEPVLRFPCVRDDVWILILLPQSECFAHRRSVPIGPRRLDEDMGQRVLPALVMDP